MSPRPFKAETLKALRREFDRQPEAARQYVRVISRRPRLKERTFQVLAGAGPEGMTLVQVFDGLVRSGYSFRSDATHLSGRASVMGGLHNVLQRLVKQGVVEREGMRYRLAGGR